MNDGDLITEAEHARKEDEQHGKSLSIITERRVRGSWVGREWG